LRGVGDLLNVIRLVPPMTTSDAEIDRALSAHELIKVRAAGLERKAREQALSAICRKTAAEAIQQVGKIFVIFRKRP